MIFSHIMGGLGNQLFQVFATIAYSIRYNQAFFFLRGEDHGPRPTHWKDFLSDLAPFTLEHIPQITYIDEMHGFDYHKIPFLGEFGCIYGYFQSDLYFREYFEIICQNIGLRERQEEIRQTYMDEYFKFHLSHDFASDKEVPYISMHFRLGDYKNNENNHPIMTLEYYQTALSKICSDRSIEYGHVLYFCEKDDNDVVKQNIDQLSVQFPQFVFHKVSDDMENWKQMLLMSLCHHHVIANSSFSWWGAYFNKRTDKMVCYPSRWFGSNMITHNTKDLCPSNWTKI